MSVIEVLLEGMKSGSLGPATIVGSAAFNLLCISAVCVVAIPKGEVRVIKDLQVFGVTASFSIFAYIWLFLVVSVITPNVVDVWEAFITFALFPILVGLAFAADKGLLSIGTIRDDILTPKVIMADMCKDEIAAFEMKLTQQHGRNLTETQLKKLITCEFSMPKTRAAYRVGATRSLFGGKPVASVSKPMRMTKNLNSVVPIDKNCDTMCGEDEPRSHSDTMVQFESDSYAVLENIGWLTVHICREGNLSRKVLVDYETRDGTATGGLDYRSVHGTIEFAPGETRKELKVEIIDDNDFEDDEDFYLDLSNPRGENPTTILDLGETKSTKVMIVDDDDPGVLAFETDTLCVTEGLENKMCSAIVRRQWGSTGTITCSYATEDESAMKGIDYLPVSGTLTFCQGQLSATIELTILPQGRYESKEEFRLILTDPTGGARFDPETDGGEDSCILTVVIQGDEEAMGRVDKVQRILQMNWDQTQIGHKNWRAQFRSAFMVNGNPDCEEEEEEEEATVLSWCVHIVALFWKVLAACIPPAEMCGGWFCFVVALIFIGAVTAVIGEMAKLLGCVLDISEFTTAITFVALGTSLPDTFASKTAAVQDKYADASIGNVTGSNSVNVFLGLGLPWVLCSIYWAAAGRTSDWQNVYRNTLSNFNDVNQGIGKFVVIGGGLGSSVVVFTCCSITAIVLLLVRRRVFGGELGGPVQFKWASGIFLVFLWILYIVISVTSQSSC